MVQLDTERPLIERAKPYRSTIVDVLRRMRSAVQMTGRLSFALSVPFAVALLNALCWFAGIKLLFAMASTLVVVICSSFILVLSLLGLCLLLANST